MSNQGRSARHFEEVHGKYDEVVAAAWADPQLKARLLQNPREVFDEYGIPVPANVNLRLLENTPNEWYFVIPGPPHLGKVEEIAAGVAAATCCC